MPANKKEQTTTLGGILLDHIRPESDSTYRRDAAAVLHVESGRAGPAARGNAAAAAFPSLGAIRCTAGRGHPWPAHHRMAILVDICFLLVLFLLFFK